MAHPPPPPGPAAPRRAALARALGGLVLLALPSRAAAAVGFMCEMFGDCDYESPGFQFTVTDRETGRPLADVHAMAEWITHGMHGRGGPLMVQDAVSGDDGVVRFPPWGPMRGAPQGLVINSDPLVTLFRAGYKTLLLVNAVPMGIEEKDRVRGFQLGRQAAALQPFRGTPDEWVQELRKAVYIDSRGSMAPETSARFRSPYSNRIRRALAAAEGVPARYRDPGQWLWHMEGFLRRLEGGER